MRTFTHPSVRNGSITHDGAEYPIEDGVFEAPEEVAAQIHGAVPYDPDQAPHRGPTLEEFIAAGYLAENYPPQGFEEVPSPGLEAFRASLAAKSGICAVNVEKAKALVAAADSADALKALLDAELANTPAPRVSVTRAIEKRLAELPPTPPAA